MSEFWEYKQRIKKFYTFSNEEIKGLIVSVILLAFIWSFNYKSETFNLFNWFGNYFIALIMMAIAMFLHVSAQKIVGIRYGFYVEYKMWLNGLIAGVIVTLLTNGFLPLLIPGGIVLMHLTRLRIGEFRYGLNLLESNYTVLAGPFTNIFVAMFFKFLIWQVLGFELQIVDDFFRLNLILAVYMLLPINPLPGVIAMIGSKLIYVYMFASFLSYSLLIILFNFYSVIWGALIGGIIYITYYWTVERSKDE
ncbi:MAG: hypothetical protein ACMXX8_00245 [Candidatus Woesearchaeota archaeon]